MPQNLLRRLDVAGNALRSARRTFLPHILRAVAAVALTVPLTALPATPAAGTGLYYYSEDCQRAIFNDIIKALKEQSDEQGLKLSGSCGAAGVGELNSYLESNTRFADALLIISSQRQSIVEQVHKARKLQLPVMLMGSDPGNRLMESYPNVWYIGPDVRHAGRFQSDLLHFYSQYTALWDRDGNGTLDYVMLMGSPERPESSARAKTFKAGLKQHRLPGKTVLEENCPGGGAQAESIMDDYLRQSDGMNAYTLDAVICFDDELALGAVNALQKHDHNRGIDNLYVPVIGLGGSDEALEQIQQRHFYGTVTFDEESLAATAVKMTMLFKDNPNPPLSKSVLGHEVREHRVLVPHALIYRNLGEMVRRELGQ